jgi:hypothetical protein
MAFSISCWAEEVNIYEEFIHKFSGDGQAALR